MKRLRTVEQATEHFRKTRDHLQSTGEIEAAESLSAVFGGSWTTSTELLIDLYEALTEAAELVSDSFPKKDKQELRAAAKSILKLTKLGW